MRLKTYNADSVQAALRLARIELGDEAVLIGSSENAKGATGAKLSVTFGTDLSGGGVNQIVEPAQNPLEEAAALKEPLGEPYGKSCGGCEATSIGCAIARAKAALWSRRLRPCSRTSWWANSSCAW